MVLRMVGELLDRFTLFVGALLEAVVAAAAAAATACPVLSPATLAAAARCPLSCRLWAGAPHTRWNVPS